MQVNRFPPSVPAAEGRVVCEARRIWSHYPRPVRQKGTPIEVPKVIHQRQSTPQPALAVGQGGLRSEAHAEPLPTTRSSKSPPKLCPFSTHQSRASPYTINAATMQPRGVDPPAPPGTIS